MVQRCPLLIRLVSGSGGFCMLLYEELQLQIEKRQILHCSHYANISSTRSGDTVLNILTAHR